MSLFDELIYCPKCRTVKVKDKIPPEKEDEEKFEACWACGNSFKASEWKTPITSLY